MSLVCVGLNHQTSPLALRERLHFPEEAVPGALLRLKKRLEGAAAVILSTCNRVEIYLNHGADAETLHGELCAFLSNWHGVPEDEFRESLYVYTGLDTVGHLFRVASSLDSMVVGEGQILGQVHDAYHLAHAQQATDKIISALFQKAFAVAKNVRTSTKISTGKVSIGSVAADLAVSIFMSLTGKTVMVIGSGKMGELTLKSLLSSGTDKVVVVNRNVDKAVELASTCNGEPLALDDLQDHLHRADIIITSTAAPDLILQPAHFQGALKRRSQEPMFVIDIAVPRDVDPAVNDLDNVYLYDVDDLQGVANTNLEARRKEIAACMDIVEHGANQFWRWMQGLVAEPTIVSMAEELNAIREQELQETLSALSGLTDRQRDEITYLTKRIVNKILQRPMSQLKREVVREDPHTVLHLVKRLFGLKEGP